MSRVKTIVATALGAMFTAAIPVVVLTHSAQAANKPVIRYVYKTNSTWWPPEIDKLMKAEAEKLGVDYQVVGPENGDIAKQVQMIENYVSQKVDALVVSSLGPATCQAVDDAVDAGIKVVMADGDCPDSKRLVYYGSDNVSLGRDTAKLFAEAVKGKGHQKILVVTGTPGAANLQEREKGFKDEVKALGLDADFLPTIPSYEDTQKAIDAIESSLRADTSINAVYVTALWPFQAEPSALPTMVQRVKDGKLTVVSIDTFPNGLKMVEDGIVYGMVAQNYGQLTVGPLAVAYQAAVKGVQYPKVCNFANISVTKDGGPGKVTATAFYKKMWTDFDWDTHEASPADCQK